MSIIANIKFNEAQINQFKKLGVSVIYIYGSQATGLSNFASDIDIGVVFSNPEKYKDKTMKVYNELYFIFTDIFPGKKVDIVLLQFASPTLQFKAVSDGVVIYEKNAQSNFEYKEAVIKKYADIKYFLDLRAQEVLNRI